MGTTNQVKYSWDLRGQPLVLIGFMGSGKTTVGRRLARALGLKFLDLDAEIVRRAGRSISEIFERQGEEGFRRLEARVLRAALKPGVCLAAGGGLPLRAANRTTLRSSRALVVWLEPAWAVLWARLKRMPASKRPLLYDAARSRPKSQAAVKQLWARRREAYERCADVRRRVPARESAAITAQRLARVLRPIS